MKKGAVVLVVVVVTAALTLVPRVAVDLHSNVFVSPNPPGYTLRSVKATNDRGEIVFCMPRVIEMSVSCS